MIVWSAVGFDQFVATRLISTSHMNSHSVVSTAFKHVRVSAWLVGFATVAEDADQYQRCCFGGSHAQFDNIFPLLGRAIWDATENFERCVNWPVHRASVQGNSTFVVNRYRSSENCVGRVRRYKRKQIESPVFSLGYLLVHVSHLPLKESGRRMNRLSGRGSL
ncbi:hypothetical protein BLIN9172_03491 [Brevibacterium linens ATCC 9172]|uniref:Uncharacterized protein n=1 Tax=Brevibacterium linens ATCC 9172 TaxID=1255617 RepID=A0A2H1KRY4_BRELN|nr:hypothetical protein BLIN9172_03491 [Brevibacterium linens ATCC 9172]